LDSSRRFQPLRRSRAWRGDGKEIFYITRNQRLMAVSFQPTVKGMEVSQPSPLFDVAVAPAAKPQYDVTADGQRFLVNSLVDESETPDHNRPQLDCGFKEVSVAE
jgi:hypothetical protein